MSTEVRAIVRRQRQLDYLSYFLVLSLLLLVGVLGLMVLANLDESIVPLMGSAYIQAFVPGLLLVVIVYLADGQRRLRSAIVATHTELNSSREELQASWERLEFAHRVAMLAGPLNDESLKTALVEAALHFKADVAAVLSDEMSLFSEDGVIHPDAEPVLFKTAVEVVNAGEAVLLSPDHDRISVVAVPLRVRGKLKSVLALWRAEGEFTQDDLEGVQVVARIIELSMENRGLLDKAGTTARRDRAMTLPV